MTWRNDWPSEASTLGPRATQHYTDPFHGAVAHGREGGAAHGAGGEARAAAAAHEVPAAALRHGRLHPL